MSSIETTSPKIAVIGGTGIGNLFVDSPTTNQTIETRWGSVSLQSGTISGKSVAFLPRHGVGHRLPPSGIPYRANIAALKQVGIHAVIATSAVGSLKISHKPGDLLIPDDFIDFTGERTGKTFFDKSGQIVHTDFTQPYSHDLRDALSRAAASENIGVIDGGVYLCVNGPRYESPAEVRLFAQWGADVVGMTGIPEATLAREASIHYATIAPITNYGVGINNEPVSHDAVEEVMRGVEHRLHTLIRTAIERIEPENMPSIGSGLPLPNFL